jgi:O-antigen/teichoic acid export membrane protein
VKAARQLLLTPLQRLARGVSTLSLAVADQGLAAGANYLSAILLARWMEPADYGGFAVAASILALLAMLQQALFLDPMIAIGPSKYRSQPCYVAAHTLTQLAAVIIVAGVLGGACLVASAGGADVAATSILSGLALGVTPYLYFRYLRYAAYLLCSPGAAASGSLLYSACLFAGLFGLRHFDMLSIRSVLILFGAASVPVVLLMALTLRLPWRISLLDPVWEGWFRRHWDYGRWELGGAFASWAGSNVWLAFAGTALTLSQVGGLRALTNLLLPESNGIAAMRRLLLPRLAGLSGEVERRSMRGPIRNTTMLFMGSAGVYAALLCLFSQEVLHFLYGGRFVEYSGLVPLLAATTVLHAGAEGFCTGLRALQSPSSACTVTVVATLASLAIGIPAVVHWGVEGVIMTTFVTHLILFSHAWLLCSNQLRVQRDGAVAGMPGGVEI